MGVFLGFQNCATLQTPNQQSSVSKVPQLEKKFGIQLDQAPRGEVKIWALGSADELLPPQARTPQKLFGKETEDRYREALAFAKTNCNQKISRNVETQRIYFEITNEGRYLASCSGDLNDAAYRQPASEKAPEPDSEATGLLKIRYPDLKTEVSETPELFYKDNEFRFLAAKLIAQDHCGSRTEKGQEIRKVEFEVIGKDGKREGVYRINCGKNLDVSVYRAL